MRRLVFASLGALATVTLFDPARQSGIGMAFALANGFADCVATVVHLR